MDMSEEEFAGIDAFVQQKSLVDPVITAQNLFSIYQCPDQQMYRARIQFLFNLDQYVFDQPSLEALIDMMHGAILFASDNDFAYPKAIVFLSIYLHIFRLTRSSSFYLPEKLFKKYEEILLAHSVDRPPKATLIFELADIKLINDFFINTFFRHIKLIINCFTQKPLLSFRTAFPVQVSPISLPPLLEMEMVPKEKPEGEEAKTEASGEQTPTIPTQQAQQKPGKSPKSPRSPRDKKEASEKTSGKGKDGNKSQGTSAREAALAEAAKEANAEGEQPEEPGPDVPIEMLRDSLQQMHEKFIADFEEKEKLLYGKIKELEIRIQEKPQVKKPPPKKK
ncbi:hypothetical protein M9Y10_013210 [Tritrichomonas musculus]|uniref:Uncharacterized protein n=1 Tax=Tritrichomonas musculus TaxID=1915356 RepID=A0ABR2I8V7_9EUKA